MERESIRKWEGRSHHFSACGYKNIIHKVRYMCLSWFCVLQTQMDERRDLKEFLHQYLLKHHGERAGQWAYSLLDGIKRYLEDDFICLFYDILQGKVGAFVCSKKKGKWKCGAQWLSRPSDPHSTCRRFYTGWLFDTTLPFYPGLDLALKMSCNQWEAYCWATNTHVE